MKKILIVDDEKDIIEFLSYSLRQEGFEVISAGNGIEALEQLEKDPDIVVLDVMMPKMDGYEVLSSIRKMPGKERTPVIFLTAKSSENDEIKGLGLGANDYITKPVSLPKLIARINAHLRYSDEAQINEKSEVIQLEQGAIEINRIKFTVTLDGAVVVFAKKEFELFYYLAVNKGKVMGRDQVLKSVWGADVYVVERTIDVHIRKVREKLGKYANLIETVKGVGYRLKES